MQQPLIRPGEPVQVLDEHRARHEQRVQDDVRARDLVRIATCGSVDDGKSTLIGRLLFDAGLVADDHLEALERETRGRPAGPEGYDLSLLVDGLMAEREQGITIDVAYRYVTTERRSFILADSPGHEQYTRNMATAASTADAAILLVDARQGVVTQTRRHTTILGLFGVRRVALAINKMDLVGFDKNVAAAITAELESFAAQVGIKAITAIPVSALEGANVVRRGDASPWYRGPTLLEWMESVEPSPDRAGDRFRMPVQWVNRADADFRGLAGLITGGRVKVGDLVAVAGSPPRQTQVAQIVTMEGEREEARAGQSVTLVLADAVDAGRGDLVTGANAPVVWANQFAADIIWFDDEPLLPGRSYLARIGTNLVPATVTELKHRLSIGTLERAAAKTLSANDVGFGNIALERPVAFESYADHPELGGFILIDRLTNATVGAGMIAHPLERATNLTWQTFDTDRSDRSRQNHHRPLIIWLTGLSGAGKSTIANLTERRLSEAGLHTYILDGDNLRHGLNKDLGFTEADRVENVRRAAEVARLMADAGLVVIVSLISPFRRERALAREIAGEIGFLEVFIDAPLEVCAARDPKGLYAKARSGQIRNFTGLGSPYERPEQPDLRLGTAEASAAMLSEDLVGRVLALSRLQAGER